jgi:hypothetical protein
MSFTTKSVKIPAEQSEDPNHFAGAPATEETKPRTKLGSLVSRISIKGRSTTKESSTGDHSGRSSSVRKEESVILTGSGSASENQIPLNLEKEVIHI